MGATAAIAIANLAGAYSQSEAAKARGQFEQQQAEINARFADIKKREALRMGDKAAAEHGRRIKSLVGKQRTALAAQGVQVDSGTAAEIQEQTREIGRDEMETIRNNAWREAFGYEQAALADRTSGQFARIAGDFSARNTLITGGLNALDIYARGYKESLAAPAPSSNPADSPIFAVWDPARVQEDS